MQTEFKPGSLVSLHHRDWVVLPSQDEQVILLKPLGGTDAEIKGVYRDLANDLELIQPAEFAPPGPEHLGHFSSALVLYNAARLSFRNGAGPFRSMGQLSFRPRSYQLVPLIMALRLPTKRLLIADDVGVGKTIEALLIVREMLDRAEIKGFAVICLPHLCDQWQRELKDKFGIEAVIIRSGTIKSLERELSADETIFQHYRYQIISIDYIKGDRKREVFLNHVPDLVIVDEAHTCAQPKGSHGGQMQRHRLVKAIAADATQHLLLLTATPHSGKQEEFQSILGLLDPSFEALDIVEASSSQKKKVAQHFVQRRRKNVEQWLDEKTPFPEREPLELSYQLSPAYRKVFYAVLKLARNLAKGGAGETAFSARLRYYLAIGLIRGVMSSPATGEAMLHKKLEKSLMESDEGENESEYIQPALLDDDAQQQEDKAPTELVDRAAFSSSEQKAIRALRDQVAKLRGFEHDEKAAATFRTLKKWLKTDNVIVFCRYIQTANYLGELLQPALKKTFGKQLVLEVITSELSDEERKRKVEELGEDPRSKKLIIATDCMSEGINLQEKFSAALHYDLPWNPNRLEQREGRIDRFGQPKKTVKTLLLYGEDNPMDGTVLKVLLRKARQIRQSIGISVPFPDDSKSIMDAVLTAVLLKEQKAEDNTEQLGFDFGNSDEVKQKEREVEAAYERIKEREKKITSVFAQNAIKPDELLPYLRETDEALGNAETVQWLLQEAMSMLGATLTPSEKGFQLHTTNLPLQLKGYLPSKEKLAISFESPTPPNHLYLSRNHAFVEGLCQYLLEAALAADPHIGVARAAVFRSEEITQRTTLYLLRVRNVIANQKGENELVAEEMKLWGLAVTGEEESFLDPEEAMTLLKKARLSTEVGKHTSLDQLSHALEDYQRCKTYALTLAESRATHMEEGHEQFRKTIDGNQYRKVMPVLPPDVLGVYVILPEIKMP